jgi:hypothetical protein
MVNREEYEEQQEKVLAILSKNHSQQLMSTIGISNAPFVVENNIQQIFFVLNAGIIEDWPSTYTEQSPITTSGNFMPGGGANLGPFSWQDNVLTTTSAGRSLL